jgi:hypothetical protein
MNLSRRSILTGLIAAPLVVRTPGLIMPVRSWHAAIRGQIGWMGEPMPNGHRLYLVISDGRRWHPVMSRPDPAWRGNLAIPCRGWEIGAVPFPLVGSAPVDGPAAICA